MKFIDLELAAKLEGVSAETIRRRIRQGKYPDWAIEREARDVGGFQYKVSILALSSDAQAFIDKSSNLNNDVTASPLRSGKSSGVLPCAGAGEVKKRKRRSDAGTTKADETLIMRCAAIITQAKSSSPNRLNKGYGYREGYEFFKQRTVEDGNELISYRQFVNLTKPFVDREVQKKVNLGNTRYKNERSLKLLHDYSIYEPMQFIQSDHSQFDCVCIHDGKIIRPWAAFHNSVGDRILSYPTIVERPDSFSLADNLTNFVFRYGLSANEVIYKTDNGKAMKSRLMTKNGFEDITYKGYDIEERHLQAMKLMFKGEMHEKGLLQNLGMIEQHSGSREPWTKLIERNFGIGGTMEWFKDRPEYTGRKYEEKPEVLEKLIKRGHLWTSEEMIDYVMNKVDDYNNREHSSIKKEAKGVWAVPHIYQLDINYFRSDRRVLEAFSGVLPESMSEVVRIFNDPEFAKNELGTNLYSPMWRRKIYELCGWESRAVPSRDVLAMLVMKSEERTVHPYGINLGGQTYISFALAEWIGSKVIVRYSPSNVIKIREQSGKEKIYISELYVFSNKEEFICIAEPHQKTTPGLAATGYAKTFISARTEHGREITRSQKITSQIAEETLGKRELSTPVIQLNSFREEAAKEMNEAKRIKTEKEKIKKIVDEETENKLSAIYGTKVKFEEG